MIQRIDKQNHYKEISGTYSRLATRNHYKESSGTCNELTTDDGNTKPLNESAYSTTTNYTKTQPIKDISIKNPANKTINKEITCININQLKTIKIPTLDEHARNCVETKFGEN